MFAPPTTPRPEVPPQAEATTPALIRQEAANQAKQAKQEAQTAKMKTQIEATIAAGNARTIQECLESVARMFEDESDEEPIYKND